MEFLKSLANINQEGDPSAFFDGDPINVTQPFLPPLQDFLPYLQEIWDSRILTNGGPFHKRLELALRDVLKVKHLALFCNGTTALLTALKALNVTGEVITTPYTFVATSHALSWSGIEPIFVDIDPVTLNIDPRRVEDAITPRTSAILPVHCYGMPCDVEEIARIAGRHGLRVIYDAAHAFGVEDPKGSILRHGDMSVLSLHSTKVFNTLEGGAIICRDKEVSRKIKRMRNFGIVDEMTVSEFGINGKLNEISAAFGLIQLNYHSAGLARRQAIDTDYRTALRTISGIRCLWQSEHQKYNYGYFPILVEEDYPLSRDDLYFELRKRGINSRRYFYPLVSNLPMYVNLPSAAKDNLPIANRIANQILCLPIYSAMTEEQQERVVKVIDNLSRQR